MFFTNELFAADVATKAPGGAYAAIMNIVPFILIFAVFYLILILPQRRKRKAQQRMIDSLKGGDVVLLSSGIIAKIVRLKDQERLIVKTSESSELEIVRHAVVRMMDK